MEEGKAQATPGYNANDQSNDNGTNRFLYTETNKGEQVSDVAHMMVETGGSGGRVSVPSKCAFLA